MVSRDDDSRQVDVMVYMSPEGCLVASAYRGYTCNDCNCFHIDLLDDNGKPFATLSIEEHDLEDVARSLFAFAAKVAMDRLYDDKAIS